MAKLEEHLKVDRCPHCSVDNPNLSMIQNKFSTTADNGSNTRHWKVYKCRRCGGVVVAWAYDDREVRATFPSVDKLDDNLPVKVRSYLQQAIDSTFAPAGSVMLCASAVDAMLKDKGYLDGSLHTRINKAADDGLLTKEMSTWAHQVRLDANDQRHSDTEGTLPTVEDAKQSIEFTRTLAELLFVLPAKVTRGISTSKHQ